MANSCDVVVIGLGPGGEATATALAKAGLSGTWQGMDLGSLAPVTPEPAFGFGSTPERPSVTAIVTTVDVA